MKPADEVTVAAGGARSSNPRISLAKPKLLAVCNVDSMAWAFLRPWLTGCGTPVTRFTLPAHRVVGCQGPVDDGVESAAPGGHQPSGLRHDAGVHGKPNPVGAR